MFSQHMEISVEVQYSLAALAVAERRRPRAAETRAVVRMVVNLVGINERVFVERVSVDEVEGRAEDNGGFKDARWGSYIWGDFLKSDFLKGGPETGCHNSLDL